MSNASDRMIGRSTQREIPPTRRQRVELAKVVQHYVSARRPTPPLTAAELRMHAESIIKGAGVEETFRKYVTVLLNNEVWRERVAATPFNRRLLLLPKCFRAESAERSCPGTFDQLGLNCRGCGLCQISTLKREAERLGYVVLVAEGSAAVTAVIESAKLEAIIGVSCLSVLERVFPHMESAAIPGLAIPLLYDGCRETAADADDMWDAINLTAADHSRRLDLDAIRHHVEAWFMPESLAELLGRPQSEAERIAQAWLARSGKRWRPFLTAAAHCALSQEHADSNSAKKQASAAPRSGWKSFCGGADSTELARLGVAVECFHKASLIHDDIEDGDATRYGEPTLHEQHGLPVALNVGDFLLGEGYRAITAVDAPAEVTSGMLAVAAAGHRQLCLGQGEELSWMRSPRPLSPGEVLAIFRHKTAPAFEVALRLGALLADCGDGIEQVLTQYSAFLGIAYQIRDDLEDFAAHADAPGDAMAMRPSLLLAVACELADGDDRRMLERLWRRQDRPEQVMARLVQVLAELEVRETVTQLLESYKAEAVRALAPLDNASLKGLLRRVIGRIFNDTELKGWCRDVEAENATGGQSGAGSAA